MIGAQCNASNHFRGLHIAIIDPETGEVDWAQVFDTYKCSDELESALETIKPGKIIAVACKDECSCCLSEKVKDYFKSIGSQDIEKVGYR